MTLLEIIQASLKKSGIPEKYADQILKTFKVEKEDEVESAVALFKENIYPMITDVQTAATTAGQSAIEEYEKRNNLKDGKPVEVAPVVAQVDTSKLSPELKALFEVQSAQITQLTKLVSGVVTTQSNSQKLETVRIKMKGKIDDDFLEDYAGRVNLDAENLDAEIEAKVKEHATMRQKYVNKMVAEGKYTPADGGASDKDFDDFLNGTIAKGEDSFPGIKI